MAPRMAAVVCWCALFCLVFVVKSATGCSYSREDLFPTFIASSVDLLDILLKGALTFAHAVKRRRRGKRAGALVRLRTPLPGIVLSNVRSLCNKVDELQLLLGRNRDFSSSSVLCFTETWLCGAVPDSALQLAGFQLHRADRDAELTGKRKGGGICFYVNSNWCNDVTVILQHCSPHLESFIINSKPFYSPPSAQRRLTALHLQELLWTLIGQIQRKT